MDETMGKLPDTPLPKAGHDSSAKAQRSVRDYTLGEEIANSITHGIGAALAIAALVLLIVRSVSDGGGMLLLAALVYGISLLVEYLMSTLYHAIAVPAAKRVFKVLDHSGIYLLIAGTYTPYCLVTLEPVGACGSGCSSGWWPWPGWPARRSGPSGRAGCPPCST